jgi:hypothetical protein
MTASPRDNCRDSSVSVVHNMACSFRSGLLPTSKVRPEPVVGNE